MAADRGSARTGYGASPLEAGDHRTGDAEQGGLARLVWGGAARQPSGEFEEVISEDAHGARHGRKGQVRERAKASESFRLQSSFQGLSNLHLMALLIRVILAVRWTLGGFVHSSLTHQQLKCVDK